MVKPGQKKGDHLRKLVGCTTAQTYCQCADVYS